MQIFLQSLVRASGLRHGIRKPRHNVCADGKNDRKKKHEIERTRKRKLKKK